MNKNIFQRAFGLDLGGIDAEARTLKCTFSSEEPYERYFGTEILDHSPDSIDMSRLRGGAALLWNHNRDEQIGVVESAEIKDKKLLATVRFSKNNELAKTIFSDIQDGIVRNVSIGYQITKMLDETPDKEEKRFRAVRWMPLELTICSVPADQSVGIGRSSELPEGVVIERQNEPAQPPKPEPVRKIIIIK